MTTAPPAPGEHGAAPGKAAQSAPQPVPAEPPASAAASAAAATPIANRYRGEAARIIQAALADPGAYEKLAYLTDRIGHRLSGSKGLERAVAWAAATMTAEGHENVRTEKVMVPHWVRGHESAEILAPVQQPLVILGLGGTPGTGPEGVEGELVVVRDFDHLRSLGAAVAGKIVLFNKPMPPYHHEHGTGYGDAAEYRMRGPLRAAQLGAKAALVRSVTARSLRTPHTGMTSFPPDAPRIPAAAVTIEDAEHLARLAASGASVRVRLKLGAQTLPDAESANVLAELRGRERPEEIVLIGAHLDSWDVGQGAHDDGAGCVIVMHALTVLRRLELQPRRTIRVVLFTNEENGTRGARAYASEHADEIPRHVMAMESDSGGFAPQGFTVQDQPAALAQVTDIVTLLAPLGATRTENGFSGVDIMPLARAGVPSLGLWVDESSYFDIHHTPADTLDKVDPKDLAANVAAVAVMAYVVADMDERLGSPAPVASEAASKP